MRLVLASSSPRRRELLHAVGLEFDVVVSHVEEIPGAGERVEDYVRRLSREKAEEVAKRHPEQWVIAADTVVYLDDEILEKPRDDAHAIAMLERIAGREHVVYSGVTLHCAARGVTETELCTSRVTMAPMTSEEIEAYVATGEPLDKAGAYAIQGIGALLVDAVDGNYTNVVGLPLPTLYRMLKNAGAWSLTDAMEQERT
ncbi:MAG: Maf family protein [Thermoanaerobaculia bacterium]